MYILSIYSADMQSECAQPSVQLEQENSKDVSILKHLIN